MLSPSLPFVVAFLTFVVTLVPLSYWVYSDAIARGSSFPSFWGVTAVLFWPAGLYYLIRYRHLHERRHPPTRGNRIAFIVALSSFSAMFAGPFLAPPDTHSRRYSTGSPSSRRRFRSHTCSSIGVSPNERWRMRSDRSQSSNPSTDSTFY
ncbi:hypothetical protein [Haladaptatus pallidirubidus]|uniref:hypothetical protein n=1 Tax=Haladaptatus pallidirubidus TaxID=1008152 RepID=UPI001D1066E8|nr:hypothetical protein [Haladaptatus pallidirubidus]